MAKGINKVFLLGNLGQDPELRNTASGVAVTTLRMATNERRKQGDEWVDHVEWHSVVCFGKTAENCGKYLSKGSQLHVIGRIQTRKWQDKEGKDRYSTEVVADDITFLGGTNGGGNRQSSSTSNPGEEEYDPSAYGDGDIPFALLISAGLGGMLAAYSGWLQILV